MMTTMGYIEHYMENFQNRRSNKDCCLTVCRSFEKRPDVCAGASVIAFSEAYQ